MTQSAPTTDLGEERLRDAVETPAPRGAVRFGGRIAYLTTHYPAVSHTFIQREVLGLRRRGVDVATFSLNAVHDDAVLTAVDDAERRSTVAIKAIPSLHLATMILRQVAAAPVAAMATIRTAMSGTRFDPAGWTKRLFQVGEALVLHRHCAERGIEHVHAHFGQAPANVAWFAADFGTRCGRGPSSFSFTIHGPQDCLDERTGTLERKVAAAAAVVAVSDYTAAQLLRRLPIESWHRLHVIRCGFVAADPADEHAALSGVGHGASSGRDATVLVVGRLSPEKGHVVAIEALAALRRSGCAVRMRFVGPGDFDATLRPHAERFGVVDCVEHVGALAPADVLLEMKEADVLALPSFAEGLPIVLMEAMSQGCPIVASGISGVPELVENNVTGLLVSPARPDLLADALQRVLTEPGLADRLAQAAEQRVHDLHDDDQQVEALASLFESIGATGVDNRGQPA